MPLKYNGVVKVMQEGVNGGILDKLRGPAVLRRPGTADYSEGLFFIFDATGD